MSPIGTPLVLLTLLAPAQPAPKVPPGAPATADYEAELNDRLGKGVTPERNAVVLLWKALGPTPEGGTGMPAEFFRRLGIPEPPRQGDYFVGLHAYMRDRLKLDQTGFAPLFDQQSWATQRPWAAKDYPHVAAWLALNEKPLAVAVEATKRPDYYNPLVSRRTEKDPGSLLGVLLPGVQKCREIGAALAARAMLRAGEGRFDDAWADLLACHRLARLVGRGGTLIEGLVGIAVDQVAATADLAYLERANLTGKQLQDRLKDLQSLPPVPSMADKVNLGERYMYLDSLRLIRRGGVGQLEALSGGPGDKSTPEELKALAALDWEPAIVSGQKWYDRMAAAMRVKDRAGREKEFDKIESELKALKQEAVRAGGLGALVGKGTPDKAVVKTIGDILIGLLVPAVRKVQSAQDRVEQVERNLHVAFALAAYRRDAGRYPARLDDLAPKYLAAVPADLFAGRPLIYRPSETGYLLYSVGVNGKDEGGRWADDDPPGDDLRVRMPLPELKRSK
jgi:hypothetical protein